MNIKKMMIDLGLEEDEAVEMIEIFMESSNADLDLLETAVKRNVAPEVAEYAHSVKGAALNFGLGEISETAREIEMSARGGILDGSFEAVMSLRKMLEEVAAAFK